MGLIDMRRRNVYKVNDKGERELVGQSFNIENQQDFEEMMSGLPEFDSHIPREHGHELDEFVEWLENTNPDRETIDTDMLMEYIEGKNHVVFERIRLCCSGCRRVNKYDLIEGFVMQSGRIMNGHTQR